MLKVFTILSAFFLIISCFGLDMETCVKIVEEQAKKVKDDYAGDKVLGRLKRQCNN
jgi:hypothetical protein